MDEMSGCIPITVLLLGTRMAYFTVDGKIPAFPYWKTDLMFAVLVISWLVVHGEWVEPHSTLI